MATLVDKLGRIRTTTLPTDLDLTDMYNLKMKKPYNNKEPPQAKPPLCSSPFITTRHCHNIRDNHAQHKLNTGCMSPGPSHPLSNGPVNKSMVSMVINKIEKGKGNMFLGKIISFHCHYSYIGTFHYQLQDSVNKDPSSPVPPPVSALDKVIDQSSPPVSALDKVIDQSSPLYEVNNQFGSPMPPLSEAFVSIVINHIEMGISFQTISFHSHYIYFSSFHQFLGKTSDIRGKKIHGLKKYRVL